MITILFLAALLPWAIAQTSISQNITVPITNPTVALQSPGTLISCQLVNITWATYLDFQGPFTINYTNEVAGQVVTTVISGVATVATNASVHVVGWRVNVPKSGYYILTGSGVGVDISASDPFTVIVTDTSCFNSTTTTSTPTPATIIATSSVSPTRSLSTSLVASATSLAGTDPSVVPVGGGNGDNSRVTTMVGSIFGSITFVALLAAIFFYRRHRSLKTHARTNSRPEKPKGHRKWGGIQSVDSNFMLEGVHTLTHSGGRSTTSRDGSVKSIHNFDETFEKGKPPVHEEETLADGLPTPFPRSRNRYSNGSARLARQDSGLAAFNTERARTASVDAATPITPLADDPFYENSPRLQGIRSQSFSMASAVHGSPQSSNLPIHSSPLTQEGPGVPRISENGGLDSNMRRSRSATASTRPMRKPVPRFDPSIEMTTSTSIYSHHSAKNSMTNVTSDSHTMLGSSVESTSPWLSDRDRAPSVNRNIGLAFQGDGPVHYLVPDMPPPTRN